MIPASKGKSEMDRMEESRTEMLMVGIHCTLVQQQNYLQEAADSHPELDRRINSH